MARTYESVGDYPWTACYPDDIEWNGEIADILPFPKSTLYPLVRRRETASIPHDVHHVAFSWLIDQGLDYEAAAVDPARDVAVAGQPLPGSAPG